MVVPDGETPLILEAQAPRKFRIHASQDLVNLTVEPVRKAALFTLAERRQVACRVPLQQREDRRRRGRSRAEVAIS